MITVTPAALELLGSQFKRTGPRPVRIYLEDSDALGLLLNLTIDTPVPEDIVHEVEGYTFLLHRDLHTDVGDVVLDANDFGFSLKSANPIASGGCGGGCSSGDDCGSDCSPDELGGCSGCTSCGS